MTRGRTPEPRARSDSPEGAQMRLDAARARITPSLDLSEAALKFFDQIVKSREVETWSRHDINVACFLARNMAHADEIDRKLSLEGYVVDGKRNPLLSAQLQVSASVLSYTRALGLAAPQRGVTSPAQEARNRAEETARSTLQRIEDDELLN
jgi:hypothetical protein